MVIIRRQWNHWLTALVELADLEALHWDRVSGGVRAPAPQPFVHGFITCDKIKDDFAHSCRHGEGPHRIKVCIVKKDNLSIWQEILDIVGPKPTRNKPIHTKPLEA
jgi:hypothetical protein